MTTSFDASFSSRDPANPANSINPIGPTAWRAILWLTVVLFGGGMMRFAFGPMQELIKLDMGLTDFQISLVQGIATGLPIGLCSLPVAWVTDHGNRLRLLIGLIAICVVGTIATGLSGSFATLFVARMLSSLGATCGVTVVISLCADLCPAHHRGRALVVLAVGVFFGSAIGYALGGLLLAQLGEHPIGLFGALKPWREIHIVMGIVGALLLLPLYTVCEPQRHEVETRDPALGATVRALWAKRRFLLPLFTGHLGVSMADTAAQIWAAPVLSRDFHLQPAQFAGWMGGIILISGLFGSVLGGFSADWGQKSGRRSGILYAAVIATAIGIPSALYPVMPTVTGFAVMLFVLLLSGTVINLVASTTIAVLIPNEERGLCMAAFGIVSSVIGLSVAPTIVTLASSAMGGEQHLAMSLAITGVVTGLMSFGGYVMASRNVPQRPAAALG
jgi:MFS family permease